MRAAGRNTTSRQLAFKLLCGGSFAQYVKLFKILLYCETTLTMGISMEPPDVCTTLVAP